MHDGDTASDQGNLYSLERFKLSPLSLALSDGLGRARGCDNILIHVYNRGEGGGAADHLNYLHHPSDAITALVFRLLVLLVFAQREYVCTGMVTCSAARGADDNLVRAGEDGRKFQHLLVGRDWDRPDAAQKVVGECGSRPAGQEREGVDCEGQCKSVLGKDRRAF